MLIVATYTFHLSCDTNRYFNVLIRSIFQLISLLLWSPVAYTSFIIPLRDHLSNLFRHSMNSTAMQEKKTSCDLSNDQKQSRVYILDSRSNIHSTNTKYRSNTVIIDVQSNQRWWWRMWQGKQLECLSTACASSEEIRERYGASCGKSSGGQPGDATVGDPQTIERPRRWNGLHELHPLTFPTCKKVTQPKNYLTSIKYVLRSTKRKIKIN